MTVPRNRRQVQLPIVGIDKRSPPTYTQEEVDAMRVTWEREHVAEELAEKTQTEISSLNARLTVLVSDLRKDRIVLANTVAVAAQAAHDIMIMSETVKAMNEQLLFRLPTPEAIELASIARRAVARNANTEESKRWWHSKTKVILATLGSVVVILQVLGSLWAIYDRVTHGTPIKFP